MIKILVVNEGQSSKLSVCNKIQNKILKKKIKNTRKVKNIQHDARKKPQQFTKCKETL